MGRSSLLLTTGLALVLAVSGSAPARERRNACDLRGPLSDFWPKVIRDWSRRIPGLNSGSAQTAVWVSLVFGDPVPGGEGRRLEEVIADWSRVQEWNWVRSEIWKRPYSRVAGKDPQERLAFRQNLILMGTPTSNPLISRALDRAGIRARPGEIEIRGRTYGGGDLLLASLAPSPFTEGKYALVLVGLSEEALSGLERLSYGETDYALFRGRRVVESGFFDKPDCATWKPGKSVRLSPDHRGWELLERGFLRYHFDPTRTGREQVGALAEREEKAIQDINSALGFPRHQGRMEIYLYASLDEKLLETGDPRVVHVEAGASAIYRLWTGESDPAFYPAALLLIRRHLGPRGSPGLRLALALATSPVFEGRPLDEWSARWISERGIPDIPRLLAEEPDPDTTDLGRVLSAASFIRYLIEQGRVAEVKQLYLNSSRWSLAASYRRILGEKLNRTEKPWAEEVSRRFPAPVFPRPASGTRLSGKSLADPEALRLLELGRSRFLERKDGEAREALAAALRLDPDLAEAHVLLARLAFRDGDAQEALREARVALERAGADLESQAWAHVTLGRAEAVRGHLSAAALELRDPVLSRGPDSPRRLADLWLENLGFSPNRKAVEEQLRREARSDLQRFEWDAAERKLKTILATNPDSAEDHFALSEVFLRHHRYWAERATLSNELHPGSTPLNPSFYGHLADRANREIEKGLILSTPELSNLKVEGNRETLTDSGAVADFDLFDPSIRIDDDPIAGLRHHFFQGRAYFFAAQYRRARQELELSLAHDGRNQRIVAWDLIYLGYIDVAEGKLESARAHFGAARKLRIGGRVSAAARKGLELVRSARSG